MKSVEENNFKDPILRFPYWSNLIAKTLQYSELKSDSRMKTASEPWGKVDIFLKEKGWKQLQK